MRAMSSMELMSHNSRAALRKPACTTVLRVASSFARCKVRNPPKMSVSGVRSSWFMFA